MEKIINFRRLKTLGEMRKILQRERFKAFNRKILKINATSKVYCNS